MKIERIENSCIEHDKFNKIVQKLYSIALTKIFAGYSPNVLVSEFKHLVCGYKIKKSNWFKLVKEMESMGIVTYHRNHFLVIHLSQEALLGAYKLNHFQPAKQRISTRQHTRRKETELL